MGALHDGHLSLIRAARAETDVVVVSIFVNPTQFGQADDLARYPRDEQRDLALAEKERVDLVFSPSPEEMYPAGFQTWVHVEQLGRGLEGDARPEHFRGVATVCLKLFTIVRPDRAYFGQKDAQQAAVVEQMVRDLNLELEIRVLPTVRDRGRARAELEKRPPHRGRKGSRNCVASSARGRARSPPRRRRRSCDRTGAARPPLAAWSSTTWRHAG